MSSEKWRSICLGLSVLKEWTHNWNTFIKLISIVLKIQNRVFFIFVNQKKYVSHTL